MVRNINNEKLYRQPLSTWRGSWRPLPGQDGGRSRTLAKRALEADSTQVKIDGLHSRSRWSASPAWNSRTGPCSGSNSSARNRAASPPSSSSPSSFSPARAYLGCFSACVCLRVARNSAYTEQHRGHIDYRSSRSSDQRRETRRGEMQDVQDHYLSSLRG